MSLNITEKGKSQSTLPESRVLWNPWFITMIIVSEYKLIYKENQDIFSKNRVRPPSVPMLW